MYVVAGMAHRPMPKMFMPEGEQTNFKCIMRFSDKNFNWIVDNFVVKGKG
jgi:hypothetical protein